MIKISRFLLLLSHQCSIDFVFIAPSALESFSLEGFTTKPITIVMSQSNSFPVTSNKQTSYSRLATQTCLASVIFLNASSESHNFRTLKHLESDYTLRQNPHYVMLASTFKMPLILPILFKFIHISSQYIYLHGKLDKAYVVCLWCSIRSFEDVGLVEIAFAGQEVFNVFYTVDKTWWNLHKNMSGSQVFTQRSVLKYFLSYFNASCNYLDHNFEGDARLCIVQLLSQRLNFELVHEKVSKHHASEIYSSAHSKNTLQDLEGHVPVTATSIDNWQATSLYREYRGKASTRMMWIPWGWMKDPLSFMIIFNKSYLRQSALLRPFDTVTWILILVSISLVTPTLTLSLWTYRTFYLHKKNDMNYQLFRNSLLMTLGAVWEQNPSELTVKKRILSFRILFLTWLLASIIITNAYTGIVISFLCTEILPSNLPKDLEELVEYSELEKFPMISVDAIDIPELNLTLHLSSALIQEYIGLVEFYRGLDFNKFHYEFINLATIYLYLENKKLLVAYERRIEIPSYITSLQQDFVLPLQFTVISTKVAVNLMADLVKGTPEIVSWMPPPESENAEQVYASTAFTIPRNFFYPLMNRYLAWIVEAGLHDIWKVKGDEYLRKWNQEELECWRQVTNMTIFWETPHCLDSLKSNPKASAAHHHYVKEDEDSQPLHIYSLYMAFILCLSGLGLGFVSFNFEICSAVWRRMKLWYWVRKELYLGTQNLRPLSTLEQ